MRRTTLLLVALVPVIAAGCGDTKKDSAAASSPPPPVKVAVDKAAVKTHEGKPVTTLRGTAEVGSTVRVGSKTVSPNSAGVWALRAGYDPERESITVLARAPGRSDTSISVAQPTRPSFAIDGPSDSRTTYQDAVTLSGTIAGVRGGSVRGARVTINGAPANVDGSKWTKAVVVSNGSRRFTIAVKKPGYDTATEQTTIRRKLSKAEKAALAAKRKAEREARIAQRRANYIASAQTIPFKQLEKNPDRYAGERVAYRGQVFQIDEDLGETVILLSVTDEGYGFWTDEIWVNYAGTTPAVEDDMITVYGTIDGSRSYDTRMGGTNDVPEMTAKYVVAE